MTSPLLHECVCVWVCWLLPFLCAHLLRKVENISVRTSSKRVGGKSKHWEKDPQIFMSSTGRNTEFHPHRLIPNCLTNSCYYYFFKWGGGAVSKREEVMVATLQPPQQPSESYSQFSLFSVYCTGGELGAWQRLINHTGLPVPSHQTRGYV